MLLLALLCVTWTGLGAGIDYQTGPGVTPVLSVRLPDDRLSPPEIRTRVLPRYPDDGAAAGLRGFIDMEVVVDQKGGVAQARIARPLRSDLDQAALDLVKQWLFRPAADPQGRPVTMLMILRIEFTPPTQAGATGGVGTTSVAVNLGCVMAADPRNSVALMDIDLCLGDADVFLDAIPDYTLVDVAQNVTRLDLYPGVFEFARLLPITSR